MAKKTSKLVVIDASVARAAGGDGAVAPISIYCRDLLDEIRKYCHRMAVSEVLLAEWKKHESRWVEQWRISMKQKGKVVAIEARQTPSKLELEIQRLIESERDLEIVMKDLFLVELAYSSDYVVVSLDRAVCRRLAMLVDKIPQLDKIVWIDPAHDGENCIHLVRSLSHARRSRTLRYYATLPTT